MDWIDKSLGLMDKDFWKMDKGLVCITKIYGWFGLQSRLDVLGFKLKVRFRLDGLLFNLDGIGFTTCI